MGDYFVLWTKTFVDTFDSCHQCIYFSFRIVHSQRSSDGTPSMPSRCIKGCVTMMSCGGQRHPTVLITSQAKSGMNITYLEEEIVVPLSEASSNIRIWEILQPSQSVISQSMFVIRNPFHADTVHIIKSFRQSGRNDIIRCAYFQI